MLFFEDRFWKLTECDKNNKLIFIEHFVAGTAKTAQKSQVMRKTRHTLQKMEPKRVNISPAGKTSLIGFNVSKNQARKSIL